MAKKRKQYKKDKVAIFSEKDFQDKNVVITQHAHEKWIERTNIKISKKRIETYIRACARQGKLQHYWEDFYIADDIVFIARKKLPTDQELLKPGYKITMKEILEKYSLINRWSGLDRSEIEKFAVYYKQKYYSGYVTNVKKKKSQTTVQRVYSTLDREDIYSLTERKKINIYMGGKYRKRRLSHKKIKSVKVSSLMRNEFKEANKDLGIVIISVFGSFKDYPCLQDIRSIVIEKNKYGKMLF